jgi:hypothetical protein
VGKDGYVSGEWSDLCYQATLENKLWKANCVRNNVYIVVLTAINEDSPTVPALLTDYILKGESVLPVFFLVG